MIRLAHLYQKDTMKIFNLIPMLLILGSCALKKPEEKNNIQKVQFSAGACFGTCPIFHMSIQENGNAEFEAEHYNDVEGKFKAVIARPQLDSLFKLINEAKLVRLKDHYDAEITCQPTYNLHVTFKDGTSKNISDYGPSGPEELGKIYSMIFSLRETQDWKK